MSLVLYPNCGVVSHSAYNDWFSTIYHGANPPALNSYRFSCFNDLRPVSQTANVAHVPNVSSFLWENERENVASEYFSPASSTVFGTPYVTNETIVEQITMKQKMNFIYDEPCNFSCNTKSLQIWRPFSPSPSRQTSTHTENMSSLAEKRPGNSTNRLAFPSITPSKVKIEASKTSVFKAVKKKSYSCSFCSSRYMNSAQLNSHMRVHTGSKPFTCEYPNCTKTFARNEELTRHRRIHSGYKPHICTICSKRFGRKDHLSKHLKTHLQVSEKKVYVCCFPGCGHRYTRSDALTRHKTSAHSIKKNKISTEGKSS